MTMSMYMPQSSPHSIAHNTQGPSLSTQSETVGAPNEHHSYEVDMAFVQKLLNGVSRSFALVIPVLEQPLALSVGTAYLLCRVCDNVEDCHEGFTWKAERFQELQMMLQCPTQVTRFLKAWASYAWPGLSEAERAMFESHIHQRLWDVFHTLEPEDQEAIIPWINRMVQGMRTSLDPHSRSVVQRENVHLLARLRDLNQYCHYVAGTVGHMCTALTEFHYGFDYTTSKALNERSEAFGRALQKTNIFKDFTKDLRRGFSYLPNEWMQTTDDTPLRLEGASDAWLQMVFQDLLDELSVAVDYIALLPTQAAGYRLFCLRAVLPAYQTLLAASQHKAQLFTEAHAFKVSRETMMQCLQEANEMVADNAPLLAYRDALQNAILAPFQK